MNDFAGLGEDPPNRTDSRSRQKPTPWRLSLPLIGIAGGCGCLGLMGLGAILVLIIAMGDPNHIRIMKNLLSTYNAIADAIEANRPDAEIERLIKTVDQLRTEYLQEVVKHPVSSAEWKKDDEYVSLMEQTMAAQIRIGEVQRSKKRVIRLSFGVP